MGIPSTSELATPIPRAVGQAAGAWRATRIPVALRLLLGSAGAASLLLAARSPASSAERCPGAETTRAQLECLGQRLEQSDRTLAATLQAIAAQGGRGVPGGPSSPRWQRFSQGLPSGADPTRQLRAFQRERHQICQVVSAMSLQGSGFGVFVLSCELDLNDALLRQVSN